MSLPINFYEALEDVLDTREFKSYEEYEKAVIDTVTVWRANITQVEQWARQNDREVHRQLGVTIIENEEKEKEDEEEILKGWDI